jgi:hypothetical protein
MGLFAKLVGAVSKSELDGIRLDTNKPHWEVSGLTNFPALLRRLSNYLPSGSILYFEGGSPVGSLAAFLRQNSVPERAHVAYSTAWPRPKTFHLVATKTLLDRLADEMENRNPLELATQFHIYQDQTVIFQWHEAFSQRNVIQWQGAFSQPMLLSGQFSEHEIRAFCDPLQLRFQRRLSSR